MALQRATARFSRSELSHELNVSLKTIGRWEKGDISSPGLVFHALTGLLGQVPDRPATRSGFRFIDLFAGIGGTRLGFESAGGECVFTSEYDRHCVETYRSNFRPTHEIAGDIRQVEPESIPDHDVLVAGFPCQPFSIAGVSKKNALGRPHGFECATQGTLFFNICKILEAKRPLAFMLENVRNLRSHDGGNTFRTINGALKDLGYYVQHRIIDAKSFVPQHRERIFIVGFREPTFFEVDRIPTPDGPGPKLSTILHPEDGSEGAEPEYTAGPQASVNPKYTLTAHLWRYLRDYAAKHQAQGNGFGFGLVTPDNIARTLSARYYKDGSEILVSRGSRKNPRRLTPRECARLMGFPDSFSIPVSDTQAYKQFGNSVVVPVIEAVAKTMSPYVLTLKSQADGKQIAMVA